MRAAEATGGQHRRASSARELGGQAMKPDGRSFYVTALFTAASGLRAARGAAPRPRLHHGERRPRSGRRVPRRARSHLQRQSGREAASGRIVHSFTPSLLAIVGRQRGELPPLGRSRLRHRLRVRGQRRPDPTVNAVRRRHWQRAVSSTTAPRRSGRPGSLGGEPGPGRGVGLLRPEGLRECAQPLRPDGEVVLEATGNVWLPDEVTGRRRRLAATRGGRGRCRPCRAVPRAPRRWPPRQGRT